MYASLAWRGVVCDAGLDYKQEGIEVLFPTVPTAVKDATFTSYPFCMECSDQHCQAF